MSKGRQQIGEISKLLLTVSEISVFSFNFKLVLKKNVYKISHLKTNILANI